MTTPTRAEEVRMAGKAKTAPRDRSVLRRRAEEIAEEKLSDSLQSYENITLEQAREFLRELSIHQIELELQNEELRRSEEELLTSKKRYFDLYEMAPVGYCTISAQGLILELNLTGATLLGATRGTLVTLPLTRFILPEDQDIFYHHHKALFTLGEAEVAELRMIRGDGTQFWARLNSTVSQDDKGALVCRLVIVDITDSKQANEALETSYKFNQSVLQTLPFPFDIIDREGRILYMNKQMEQLVHKKKKGDFCWQLYRDNGQKCTDCPLDQPIQIGKTASVESDKILGGRTIQIFHTGMMYENTEALMEVFIDVTERRKMEQKLRESDSRFAATFQQAAVGLAHVGRDGRWLRVNKKLCEFVGYHWQELIEKTFQDITHPADIEENVVYMQQLLDGKIDRFNMEKRYIKKDGSIVWGNLTASLVRDPSGEPDYCISVIEDIEHRKDVEKALGESEVIFEQFLKNSPIYVFFKDQEMRSIRLSKNYEQLLGKPVDEMLGKSMDELFPSDFAKKIIADDKKVLLDNIPVILEEEFNGKSYTTIKFPITIDSIPRYLAGYTIDITERKRIQQALEESENRFQNAMDATADGLYDWNLIENEIYYSPGWKRMLGYAEDELPNDFSVWENLTDPEDVKRSWEMMHELINKQRDRFHLEFKLQHKDGHWVDILSRAKAIFDNDGKASRIVGTHVDISERKKANAALKNEKELLRAVFEQAGGYCMVLQPTDTGIPIIIDANTAACSIHGYTRQEMIGRPISDLDDEEGKRSCRERTQFILSGKQLIFESTHIRKDGSTFPVQVFANMVQFENRPPLIVTTEFDISERKKAESEKVLLEKQLYQAQKMESVGRLAGGVAHDFNNMLSVILGFSEMAMAKIEADNPIKEDLQEVNQAARKSAQITRQLLAFARQQPADPKIIDLNETLEGMLKMLRRLIGEGINLVWMPSSEPCLTRMDPSQLDQIIANLCVNARDAIGGTGCVTIELQNTQLDEVFCDTHLGSSPGEYVELSVADDGCGMEKTTLENIFEPFFTTKELGKGTGLGLATVYGIVKQNSGYIDVVSTPGEGTKFTVFFRRQPEENIAVGQKVKENHPLGDGQTILVVEDEPSILRLTSRFLKDLGYRVVTASSPEEAVTLVSKQENIIDVLFTDVVMPGMNGRELSELLQSFRPTMKVLYMSGYSADIIDGSGVNIHEVPFIQKPFSITQLARVLQKMLRSDTYE